MKRLIQIEGDEIVRQIPLKKSEYTLGRGTENDIVFDTGKVSRLHAALVEEGNTYYVVDRDSTNHVFVNDELVRKRRLVSGDRINLSREVTLLYVSESDANEKAALMLNRLWEAINKRDFLRLKEVTNRIISLDSLDRILNVILEEVIKLVGAERGFIALTNEKGEIQTDTSVSHNIPLSENGLRRSVFSHSVVRRAIHDRENIFILNAEDKEEGYLSDSVVELELRSIMCAPLLFGDKLVGILYVDSGYQLTDFSEIDRLFFAILSDHAAIAIENARLYSRVQMSVQELREEVRESEERYRQLVELSPEAIAVHSEGKVVFVNPAAVKMLGAEKPEDIIGKPIMEIVHPDYRDIVRERVRQEVEEGQLVPLLEEKFLRLDGGSIDVEVAGAPLIYQGKPAVQVVVRDITERKRMEQELLRTKKLESVGVLAGGIAHDFNNIMQVIKGNALLAKANVEDSENVDVCLAAIERSVDNAISLTSQLLTFSKGGAPVTKAARIEVLIEESATFALRGSNVAYSLDFEENLWLVEMDSAQINHVIHNLVINAAQAMPTGGAITVSACNIEVTEDHPLDTLKEGRYVRIAVKDEGVGMSEEILERVFDPYFTTKPEGSGLGLTSCYSIITKHGGIIEAESEEDKGSTFTFYLPASSRQPEKTVPGKIVERLCGKVLVMDDDDRVREVAGKMLQKIGCSVEAASDGAEAIERYLKAKEADEPFDLVIFDLTVPGGMGGKEAIEKLREHDPAIKAIVISGYCNDPVMADPESYGFQGVIPKPFDLRDVAGTVEEVLMNPTSYP